MSAGWYLYLLWNDYQKNGGVSPEEALNEAKIKIMTRFSKLASINPVLQEEKELIKDAYSLTNKEFRDSVEQSLMDLDSNGYGTILQNIDTKANNIKELLKETNSSQVYYDELNKIIELLDQVINIGSQGGEVTSASVKKIEGVRDKAKQLESKVATQKKKGNRLGKKTLDYLADLQKDLVSNVAGYSLEIFLTLSQMTAEYYGHKYISDKLKTSVLNSGVNIQEDPLMPDFLSRIEGEIKELNGTQAKADTVRFFQADPNLGSAGGYLTIVAETAQAKNYTDMSKISLGGQFTEHSLSNLNSQGDNIFDFFPEEYLVNAAASLGYNVQLGKTDSEIIKIIKEHGESGATQDELVENWNNIIKNVSVLSAIDAIVGKDILSSAQYYVIRNKIGGQVKVISSADIISKIALDPMRILNFEGLSNNKVNKRYEMSDLNKNEFVKDKDRNTARLIRSTIVWNKVRGIILNTKIKIGSMNLSSWFTK